MKADRPLIAAGLLLAALASPLQAQSVPIDIPKIGSKLSPIGGSKVTWNYYWVDCTGLPVVKASGLPNGAQHRYRFQGTCKHLLIHSTSSTSSAVGIEYKSSNEQTTDDLGKGFVVASAEFDPASGSYDEAFQVTTDGGKFTLEAQFKCGGDPVIGNASCVRVILDADEKLFLGYFNAATALGRPLLKGHTTFAKALAVNEDPKGAAAPPPPPPAPKPQTPQRARLAAAASDAMASMLLVTQPGANANTSGPLTVEVRVGEALVESFTANGVMVRKVELEWQAARDAGTGRLRVAPWVPQDITAPVGWAGKSGGATMARASIAAAMLAAFPRWRVRATIPGTNIAPSAWVEFRHTP